MAGWYEIFKNNKGQLHFVLKVGNEQALLDHGTGKAKGDLIDRLCESG
jgi:uncharacterized protein YegP (UPF0339 family)